MNKILPVYTLKNECSDCYKCVRHCFVKAIKIESGHASVIGDKCITCGACVLNCPSKAKRVRNDIEKVKNILMPKNGVKPDVYVSLAPTFSGVFSNMPKEKLIAILKKLGFKGVSETAIGAQAVSIKTAEMLCDTSCNTDGNQNFADNNAVEQKDVKGYEQKLYISSACPAAVDFIRMYHPEFAKNITPIASPALTHAKLLKEKFGENIKVVFIGPCIAKKNEADRNPDLISAALTFDELKYWLNEEYINTEKINYEGEHFVPEDAYEGSLYPIEGGMNDTIKKCLRNYEFDEVKNIKFLTASSLETIDRVLKGFDESTLKNKIFIEALSCAAGCVGGPGISDKKSGLDIMTKIINYTKLRPEIPKEPETVVDMEYSVNPVQDKKYSVEELRKALKKIGKNSVEDELNCGGCGYSSCREMGYALLRNEAEPSQCASYMRQIAHRKADALLRCMPSAMVMVDKDLKVAEANNAFIKMFMPDMYDVYSQNPDMLKGAAIDKIVDFDFIFKTALSDYSDIHKEHYPVNDRLYDITAFTIEKDELVGAIIVDVTRSQVNREKIAQKAHEVITKNISIVQNIACLLGEHMVETELLLSSIAQDYDKDVVEDSNLVENLGENTSNEPEDEQ